MKASQIKTRFVFAVMLFTVLILMLWFGYYNVVVRMAIEGTDPSVAAVDNDSLFTNRDMFFATSLTLLAVIMIVVIALYRYLSVYIVQPMTSVIKSVASLDGELKSRLPELPDIGKSDFESLVSTINGMLDRTEQYSSELLDERQKLFDSELLQRDMRIGLLTSQIDAHFVVNTIGSIHTLCTHGDSERAGEMADGLAQLIKHRHTGDTLRNLFIELEMVEAYISVMNIRYYDRFAADYDVDDGLVEYLIPGLILQPVVENALTHGLQNKDGLAKLNICGYLEGDSVILEVADNGCGIAPEKLLEIQFALEATIIGDFPEPGLSGVALSNIQKRIKIWFGPWYGLSIDSAHGEGTTVTIKLPAIREG